VGPRERQVLKVRIILRKWSFFQLADKEFSGTGDSYEGRGIAQSSGVEQI
jgi:hypothetical protein